MISYQAASKMLRDSLNRMVSFSDDEFDKLLKLFHPLRIAKKDHWFKQGSICSEIAFVVDGCIRTVYEKNDVERTGQFFFENSWYTDYESWLTKHPSIVSVEAIEPSELWLVPFSSLEKLYNEIPRFERLGRILAENTIIRIRNRNLSLLNDSPEERYLQLLKERPKVIERIPQHLIATYLGIEPETLSRIRKKITLKG
jgi:CRP/FNR family transcriptional regulator, anaerobic regulatory protein